MEVDIKQIRSEDANDLFRLVEPFAASFRPDKGMFVQSLYELLSDESACLRAAVAESKIIGYCLGFDHYTFYANGRVAWVEEMMVEESYRKQGVGRALMRHFEEWARSRGSRLVALATRRAAPFYRALGYEESAVYFRKLLEES